MKAKSSTELMKKDNGPQGGISKDQLLSTNNKSGHGGGSKGGEKLREAPASRTKAGQVKRQRSYERGASEGTLNLPGNNRGRRSSCDLRSIDPNALNLNNNSIKGSSTSSGSTTSTSTSSTDKHGGSDGSNKHHQHQSSHQGQGQGDYHHHHNTHSRTGGGGQGQEMGQHQSGGGVKNVTSGNTEASNLVIRNDTRRRSVQM